MLPGALKAELSALEEHRREFIEHRFNLNFAPAYCHAYFSLLRSMVQGVQQGRLGARALSAALCMETCALYAEKQGVVVAAATATARNPIYLLAKLRQPKAYDDPKFLPLIVAERGKEAEGWGVDLFYHYRQFVVDSCNGISLLVYPAVRTEARAGSFRCLQSLAMGLAQRNDPRTASRSKWITDRVIAPFLESLGAKSGNATTPISIADLGGGSGDLARRVCERLLSQFPDAVRGRELAWTLVDVRPHNTRRLAKRRRLLRNLVELRCERLDWVEWIHRCWLR
jgi:hypothetical protein